MQDRKNQSILNGLLIKKKFPFLILSKIFMFLHKNKYFNMKKYLSLIAILVFYINGFAQDEVKKDLKSPELLAGGTP